MSGGTLGALRAYALAHATGVWVLSLDADERVPAGGIERLRAAAASAEGAGVVAYRLRIRTHLGARWLRWGGYYPARRLRFFRRRRGRWDPAERVHERVRVDGPVGDLDLDLEHLSFRSLQHAREKMLRYAEWAAAESVERGRPYRLAAAWPRAGWRLFRGFVLRGGFLMGATGWRLACIEGQAVLHRARVASEPRLRTTFESSEARGRLRRTRGRLHD
jgi:glycosyltransferase involved in cell wall biosynthesis